jgi:hypothetical protein
VHSTPSHTHSLSLGWSEHEVLVLTYSGVQRLLTNSRSLNKHEVLGWITGTCARVNVCVLRRESKRVLCSMYSYYFHIYVYQPTHTHIHSGAKQDRRRIRVHGGTPPRGRVRRSAVITCK